MSQVTCHMALPRSTVISTLSLVGIGIVVVIAMLIFAFSMLNGGGGGNATSEPTGTSNNFPSPTPEYLPNEGLGDVQNQPIEGSEVTPQGNI